MFILPVLVAGKEIDWMGAARTYNHGLDLGLDEMAWHGREHKGVGGWRGERIGRL